MSTQATPLPEGGEASGPLTPTGAMPAPKSSSRRKATRGAMGTLPPKPDMPPSTVSASAEGVGQPGDDTQKMIVDPQEITGPVAADTQLSAAGSGGGHNKIVNHRIGAPLKVSAGQGRLDTQVRGASGGEGHEAIDTHRASALPKESCGPTVAETHAIDAAEGGEPAPQISAAGGGGGHIGRDTRDKTASPEENEPLGQSRRDTHSHVAEDAEGRPVVDTQRTRALRTLLAEIHERSRLRNDYLRTRAGIGNRIQAVCFRLSGVDIDNWPKRKKIGNAVYALAKKGKAPTEVQMAVQPMLDAFKLVRACELVETKALKKLGAQLPVADWAEEIRGFGVLTLALIIAESDDLSNYSNPAKLWKRMGLAVIDGKSQRRCKDKKEAEKHAFSPARRALMSVVGMSIICGNKGGYYHDVYYLEKARQEQVYPELKLGHRDKKARRYMQKRLLRKLWSEWRRVVGQADGDTQITSANTRPPEERAA